MTHLSQARGILAPFTVVAALFGFYLTYTENRAALLAVTVCYTLSASVMTLRSLEERASFKIAMSASMLGLGILMVAIVLYRFLQ
jgi:hypothetical protein